MVRQCFELPMQTNLRPRKVTRDHKKKKEDGMDLFVVFCGSCGYLLDSEKDSSGFASNWIRRLGS